MLLLLTFACTTSPGPDVAWISPADGQTGVPEDLPLRVGVAGPWPEDYPLGGAISVWDAAGLAIEGETDRAGDAVFFLPTDPWSNDVRYVWRWGFDAGAPHSPAVVPFEPGQASRPTTYSFVVGGSVEMLGVALRGDETPCVVTSAPAGHVPFNQLLVAGEELPFFDVYRDTGDPEALTAPYPGGDPGLDVLCFATATDLGGRLGEEVLVNYAGRSWVGELTADVDALVAQIRRLAKYEENAP